MSRRSQRNRNRSQARNLSDSFEGESSQSSRRGNQTISPPSPEGNEDYDQYTAAAVKFILNHVATKYPIKRADLVKECCNGNTRIFSIISATVQNHLKSVSSENYNYAYRVFSFN